MSCPHCGSDNTGPGYNGDKYCWDCSSSFFRAFKVKMKKIFSRK